MAPLLNSQIPDKLAKRVYYYSNYSYRPWWLVFAIGVPLLLLILAFFLIRSRNRTRRNQGIQPIPYTGWTAPAPNNQQYQQQPYQQYDQQQYGQQQYGQNQGYYYKSGTENESAPPAYQRPDGPPPTDNTSTDTTTFQSPEGPPPTDSTSTSYQRPEGPPPGSTNYPTYPAETYKGLS